MVVPKPRAYLHTAGSSSLTDYLAVYREFNGYIRREPDLINNRLTWILTIHGFLYATYGAILLSQINNTKEIISSNIHGWCIFTSNPTYIQIDVYLVTISGVGAAISWAGYGSIKSALGAMDAIASIFDNNNDKIHKLAARNLRLRNFDGKSRSIAGEVYEAGIVEMPHIRGGGVLVNDRGGNSESLRIPVILCFGWFISLISLFSMITWLIYFR